MAQPSDEFEIVGWEKTGVLLRDLGADERLIARVNRQIGDGAVQGLVARLRRFAQENPIVVLGALSALVAGGTVAAGRAAKSAPKRRSKTAKRTAKRTLIEPHPGDKRYVRRDAKGRIKESVDVGRSLAADQRRHSKTRAKAGAGDKGDR